MLLWLCLGLLGWFLSHSQLELDSRKSLLRDAEILISATSPTQFHKLAAGQPQHLEVAHTHVRTWLDFADPALQLRMYIHEQGADLFRLVLDSQSPLAAPITLAKPNEDPFWMLLEKAQKSARPVFHTTRDTAEPFLHLVYPASMRDADASTALLLLSRQLPPRRLRGHPWGPFLLLLTLFLLVATPFASSHFRRVSKNPSAQRRDHRDLAALFLLMVCFTALAVWLVSRFEKKGLQRRFELEAHLHNLQFAEELAQLRDLELPAWKGFYAASDHVDAEEFTRFAASLKWQSFVRSWLWAHPMNPDEGSFSAFVSHGYPAQSSLLGCDLALSPALKADMLSARRLHMSYASRPIELDGTGQQLSYVFSPILSKHEDQQNLGFLVAVLDWREMLHRSSAARIIDEPRIALRLEMLVPDHTQAQLLGELHSADPSSAMRHQQMLLGLGRVFLLQAFPTAAYFHSSDFALSQTIAVVGFLFSCLLTWFFRQKVRIAAVLDLEVHKRTAALEAAYQKYRVLSDALPIGVALISPQKNVLQANPMLRGWFPAIPDAGAGETPVQAAGLPLPLPTEAPLTKEAITPAGPKTLRFHCHPLLDGNGGLYAYLEEVWDVTESERLEKRSLRHQNFLSLVTEVSSALVKAADDVWDDTLQNTLQKLGEFFDADRCCVLRQDTEPLRISNTYEWCAPGVSSQIANLQDVQYEAMPWWFDEFRTKGIVRFSNRNTLPEEASLDRAEMARQEIHSLLYLAMRDDRGKTIGALGFDSLREEQFWDEEDVSMLELLTDTITNLVLRREDRRRIRNSEEKYRLLVDNSINGVISLELLCSADGTPEDFRFLSVNPAFRTLFDRNEDTLVDCLASRALPVLLEDTCLSAFTDVALMKKPVSRDFSVKTPAPHDFMITAYSLGGLRLAAVFNDITEQMRSLRKNEELSAQLLQSQKMESIGRLAGGVAHDFNNALQIILGNADVALNFHDPKPLVRQSLEEISEAARKSSSLTHQLLAFARKQKMAPRVVDLNETVQNSLKMIRRLLGEDVGLEWLPGPDLDPVYMDPGQLDQILMNLCVNARDALGRAGRISLSSSRYMLEEEEARKYPESSPGPYARLSIADNGHGIDPAVIDKIFEPFFTTKAQGQGTGLGLATVLGIVMQNHGFIALASEPGVGTTFHVNLPFSIFESEVPGGGTPDPTLHALSGTVIVVEDEDMVLQMTTLILRKLGFTVTPCSSATEAMSLLNTLPAPPDVLLTDVVMPDLNGAKLAKAYEAAFSGLKVIYMSGYTAEVVSRHGILPDASNFIQKPFTIDQLARKMRQVLSNGG